MHGISRTFCGPAVDAKTSPSLAAKRVPRSSEAAQDWTESLAAVGSKDSGRHHRAFDGQRTYDRCDRIPGTRRAMTATLPRMTG